MARRTGRRDRGKSGIPGKVADSGAGVAVARAMVGVPAGFAARAPREGGREKMTGVSGR
jgi:hypothetical protein